MRLYSAILDSLGMWSSQAELNTKGNTPLTVTQVLWLAETWSCCGLCSAQDVQQGSPNLQKELQGQIVGFPES